MGALSEENEIICGRSLVPGDFVMKSDLSFPNNHWQYFALSFYTTNNSFTKAVTGEKSPPIGVVTGCECAYLGEFFPTLT